MLLFKTMKEAMRVEFGKVDDDILQALGGVMAVSEPETVEEIWDRENATMCKACGCISEAPNVRELIYKAKQRALEGLPAESTTFDDDFAAAFGEAVSEIKQSEALEGDFVLQRETECQCCGSHEVFTLSECEKERD